jgi:hypothetical protein
MIKKYLFSFVLTALFLVSCSEKKEFCDCVKEATNSGSKDWPKGCEYIEKMKETEQTEKAMACMGDIFKDALNNIEIESEPIEAVEEEFID